MDQALVTTLSQARSLAILTGSGISVASGIPTYRSDDSAARWRAYDPDMLSTAAGFERNPEQVWGQYREWALQVAAAQPNPAHLAVAALEQRIQPCVIITQNIDGLHQRAGASHVLEVHGSLAQPVCHGPRHAAPGGWAWAGAPPLCPQCGARLRPDVIWFGELLDAALLQAAKDAVDTSDVTLVVGTSSLVEPVASLPHRALRRQKIVIEINPDQPLRGIATWSLAGRAEQVLPQLVAALAPLD